METSPTSPQEVYILDFAANDFASLRTVDERDLDQLLDAFDGTPMGTTWTPVRMSWETEGGTRPLSDFSTIGGGGLVLSGPALEVLDDLLVGRGELLPLDVTGGEEYYVFNVTRLSEALDEEESELVYFESSGRLMAIERFEFDPDSLVGETVFKLAQKPKGHEYVTDAFRRRVEEGGLTGFVWDRRVWGPTQAVRRT